MRKYVIETNYIASGEKVSYELNEDIHKLIAKSAAAVRLENELKFDLWKKIFDGVDSELLHGIYKQRPKVVRFTVSDENGRYRRDLLFSVIIDKIEGSHSDTAGKFVGEIYLGEITVRFNDTIIAVFEPSVGSCKWTFLA